MKKTTSEKLTLSKTTLKNLTVKTGVQAGLLVMPGHPTQVTCTTGGPSFTH
jgi:hypothetical protein